MSTTTSNYKLIKPALTDAADITATNENWDTIDTELNNLNNAVEIAQTTAEDAQAIANDAIPKTGGKFTGDVNVEKEKRFVFEAGDIKYVFKVDSDGSLNIKRRNMSDNTVVDAPIEITATGKVQVKGNDIMTATGGIFTGPVTLSGAPTADLHAATKQYVDAVKTTANNAMPKSAYSLSGTTLTINW